ncbi:MAG: SGNH/GDSL hydrolase family protein [Cyanobacteria bacterium SZAS LIN-3]|nr:SGNH/GDSL hydrolase family protein [Cyanobacteria bacterium SZAS LIN-3]
MKTLTAPETTSALAKETVKTGRRWLQWPQALLYLIVSLAALEGVFYIAQVGNTEYIKPDMLVGYKPMEGKEITQRREGFGRFTFNSFGMQNDEVPLAKPAGTLRIAVLGDSYVESIQVDRKKNYCSLLARDLSKKLGRPVQVLNFGVANYSIAQDYLRYQNLARKFSPDLVILGFRVEEVAKLLPEPTNKLMSVRPVFFPKGDGHSLVYDNTCVRNFFNCSEGKRIVNTYWLRRHSNIWGVVGGMAQTVMAAGKKAEGPKPADPAAPASVAFTPGDQAIQQARANYTKCYWPLMDAQLSNFQAACRADGARMMIIRTPSGSVNQTETDLLQETSDRLGIKVLELDRKYRKTFTAADGAGHFYDHGHFTAPMHEWVEGELADFLISQHPDLLVSK